MQGGDGMIPASLRDKWELLQARAELIFLADNGGGYPDALRGDGLTPAARECSAPAWLPGQRGVRDGVGLPMGS